MLQPNSHETTFHWLSDYILQPSSTDDNPRITLLAAYATWSGIGVIAEHVRQLKEANPQSIIRAIIGSNGDQLTTREALGLLLDICDEVYIVALRNDTFHPKGYLRECGDIATLIEGSPNLTGPALFTNTEWVVRTEYDLTDSEDRESWNQVMQLVEDSINPELPGENPVGLGSPDYLEGGVWILKQEGELIEEHINNVMPRLQSDTDAKKADSDNKKQRNQNAGQNSWGSRKRSGIIRPPSYLRKADFRWTTTEEGEDSDGDSENGEEELSEGNGDEELVIPAQDDTESDESVIENDGVVEAEEETLDEGEQLSQNSVLTVLEMVEQIVEELGASVEGRDNELIWETADDLLAELEIRGVRNSYNEEPPQGTIASWKRISEKDLGGNFGIDELQGYTRALRLLTREAGEPDFTTQYLIRNGETSEQPTISNVNTGNSATQGNRARLLHHCSHAFRHTAQPHDILLMMPIRQLNRATPITEGIDIELGEDTPDCVGIILPNDTELALRITLRATENPQGAFGITSGFLIIPTEDE